MKRLLCWSLFWLILILFSGLAMAQETQTDDLSVALAGLQLREVGPAVMGGRIADIAVDPRSSSTWYIAVGSGGVWKTVNAGTTFTPIFDHQSSYSIGAVALDPSNPDVVWVGTGENVSGRHVGWGDGVYRSTDGGKSWQSKGLANSEHISRIVVDPRDSNVVFVAAEGPLWSTGGDRGLFRTTDGGQNWSNVLAIDEDTGVTDVAIDPRNPDVMYAASYQRRRHVWSLMAGGSGSGIHKSTNGGRTWTRLTNGLPKGDMGKIGLAVSPADPDVVYATIEAHDDERGFYRSENQGGSWQRQNSYISNGTGPHYYQEIIASPHDVDRVYQVDVFLHVTRDGGKNFQILGTGREKHSDNHALWIDPANPGHLLAGTDGGLYETFDEGATWRHFGNLPISQFYKLALDNSEPFYNIVGGAQDLGTLIGPSRTLNVEGISNRDWYVPLGADGYDCAFDPTDPNIVYMEWQGGNLVRVDRRTEEILDIRPQPQPDDPPERWNWDAPVLISPHSPTRLYFGSQRLWRSDDRGDSWRALSGDLTGNHNRYELEIFGRVWSIDDLYDNGAMSVYSTLTAIAESPLREGQLYVGSDDGRIQVSDDGGTSWRQAANPPDVPPLSFVNDLEASSHDADTLFAALDAHKVGDYRPLLFKSADRGRSWRSVAGNLPARAVIWAVKQDHVDPDLLFVATEFGIYTTTDGGTRWTQLKGGVPTISFRDIEIQARDNDLVGASFGRGFYVLDDYSPLRQIGAGSLDEEAFLYPVRDAWLYIPSVPMQARGKPSQGSTDYSAPNPPFGAIFTYSLKSTTESARDTRRRQEKEIRETEGDVPFPGWERLKQESLEKPPVVILTVRDATGTAVRRLEAPARAGLHRVAWDLRLPPPDPIRLQQPAFRPPWADDPKGPLAAPGRYQVEMALLTVSGVTRLGQPQAFEVVALPVGLDGTDLQMVTRFQQDTSELMRQVQGTLRELNDAGERLKFLRKALLETPRAEDELYTRLQRIEAIITDLRIALAGDHIRGRRNEPGIPSVLNRVGQVAGGHWDTRQTPTQTQVRNLQLARSAFDELRPRLADLLEREIPELESGLEAAGAPWTPGRKLPE